MVSGRDDPVSGFVKFGGKSDPKPKRSSNSVEPRSPQPIAALSRALDRNDAEDVFVGLVERDRERDDGTVILLFAFDEPDER